MKWIATGRLADGEVSVPVDTASGHHVVRHVAGRRRPGERSGRQRVVDGVRRRRLVTAPAAVDERRDLAALGHPAVGRCAADEIAAVFAEVIVRQIEAATESRRQLLSKRSRRAECRRRRRRRRGFQARACP